MIKLIASDMDGTLLDSKQKLPHDFKKVISECNNKGAKFFISSGRSYLNFIDEFSDIINDVGFICDNGACIVENNDIICESIIDKEIVLKALKICEKIEGIHVILCGTKNYYLKKIMDKEIEKPIMDYYAKSAIFVDDLKNISDDIYKIAIYDKFDPINNSLKAFIPSLGDKLSIFASGNNWADMMNFGTTKGSAVRFLQQKYNISADETMAFGDFDNDIDMLKSAKYSFAMENSFDNIKECANFVAPNNDKNGVLKMIEKYVFNKENI